MRKGWSIFTVALILFFLVIVLGCASKAVEEQMRPSPVAVSPNISASVPQAATPIPQLDVSISVAEKTGQRIMPETVNQVVSTAVAEKNDKLFQEISEVFDAVFAAAKQGQNLGNYFLSASQETELKNIGKKLAAKEKGKITQIVLRGNSTIFTKACNKDGLCKGFHLELVKSQGIWGIYEIRSERISELERQMSRQVVLPAPLPPPWSGAEEPFKITKSFFSFLSENKITDAAKLFALKSGSSSARPEDIAQELRGLQVSTIEAIYERTEENLLCLVALWNPGGDSETGKILFIKGPDKQWRIDARQFNSYWTMTGPLEE